MEKHDTKTIFPMFIILSFCMAAGGCSSDASSDADDPERIMALLAGVARAQRPAHTMTVNWTFETMAPLAILDEHKLTEDVPHTVRDYTVIVSGIKARIEYRQKGFSTKESDEPYDIRHVTYTFDGTRTLKLTERIKGKYTTPLGYQSVEDGTATLLQNELFACHLPLRDMDKLSDYQLTLLDSKEEDIYIIDTVAPDGMHCRYTIDANRGYNIVKTEWLGPNHNVTLEDTITLKRYPNGVWFPASRKRIRYHENGQEQVEHIDRFKELNLNIDVTDSDFKIDFPPTTKVWDAALGDWVVVGADEKASDVTGLVTSSNGQAVHGGEVFLAKAGMYFQIYDGYAKEPESSERTTTDENGRFRFHTEDAAFAIVVLHDAGYAQVSRTQLSRSDQIVLIPWARIEGTLHLGSEPVADAQMSLGIGQTYGRGPRVSPMDPNAPHVNWRHYGRTDEQGRFEFDRVPAGHRRRDELGRFEFDLPPAGRCLISRSVPDGDGNATCEYATVFVEPGKTQYVAMRVAAFRSVVGRIVAPESVRSQIDWASVRVDITPKIEVPHADLPEKWASMSEDDKRRWIDDWLNTEEGMAYQRAKDQQNQRMAGVGLEPDGSFRIDHVQSGPYELSVRCRERSFDGGRANTIAEVFHEFAVFGVPGAANEKPVDLGALELIPLGTAERGDMAPQFEVDTVSGQVLKLADCRGRYVLVHFWATWCGPCMEETPHLNAASDAFGDDERVVMIGLSLDSDLDSWKRYVNRNKNHWIHALLGDRSKSAVPNQYGLQGIPETFLVGPDGKILARGLRGEAIQKAVADALK